MKNIVLHYLVGPSLGPCGPELGGGVLLAEVLELRVTRYVDTGDQVKLEHNTINVFHETFCNDLSKHFQRIFSTFYDII
jgi:hypothetical protein